MGKKISSFKAFKEAGQTSQKGKFKPKGQSKIAKHLKGGKQGPKGYKTLESEDVSETKAVQVSPEIDGIKVQQVDWNTFKEQAKDKEGIVITGTGGDVDEWINGVSSTLVEEGIAKGTAKDMWSEIYVLTTTGGRTDTALVFAPKTTCNVGKMAMWRIGFSQSCTPTSWISDYLHNYASQHGGAAESDFEPTDTDENMDEGQKPYKEKTKNNSYNRKRKVYDFKEFKGNQKKSSTGKHTEKGEAKLTNDHYSGDKKGDKGISTIEKPGKITIPKK